MTGSSINFKPVMSAQSAVSHASRTVAPKYLLPPKKSLGTIVLLDDIGKVAQTLDAKMALSSRQAKAAKNFSPVWEGVLNLPRPDLEDPKFDVEAYKKHCIEITNSWIDEYQKATNHKVLRADIHLDEGHIEDGKTLLNAHAHIISDKTNERGKVFIINRGEMRKLQDMTAKVTNLKRGQTSYETGRAHLNPTAFKAVAKSAMLESQEKVNHAKLENLKRNEKQIKDVTKKLTDTHAAEIAKLNEKYRLDRERMKQENTDALAAGLAKMYSQKDYQALKKDHEAELGKVKKERDDALVALKESNQKVETMTTQITQLTDEKAQLEAQAAKWAAKTAHRDAELAKGVPWTEIDTTDVVAPDPRTSQSNTMTPAPVVPLGPNARARLRAEQMALEAARTAQEPPKQPEAPIPSPKPAKSLVERLGDSMRAMLDWIKGVGVHVAIDTNINQTHSGAVKHLDDLHAVQHKGQGRYAVHRLADLDKVPQLDDPKTSITYRGGVGHVEGKTGPGLQR